MLCRKSFTTSRTRQYNYRTFRLRLCRPLFGPRHQAVHGHGWAMELYEHRHLYLNLYLCLHCHPRGGTCSIAFPISKTSDSAAAVPRLCSCILSLSMSPVR